MITDAVAHGSRLTGQLLAFARRQELRIQAEDANRMLQEVESLLRHAAGPNVRLVLALAPGL
ncbi:hypothetical protein [Rhodospirillaceae bacterium SYSU D60014]|uniref:hypothetical protein n=1 Tax=Virgifigura deserti TaxID=2268457 RepID=UPI000E66077A